MSAAIITWEDKVTGDPITAEDAAEVKTGINDHAALIDGLETSKANASAVSNVDNTSDANKPVSTAQATAIAAALATAIQRANHTGSQTASTISDFQTKVSENTDVVAMKAIIGSGISDGDALVDTLAEMLATFTTYSEGVDIATQLAAKMLKSANLSDVADAAAARVNIGANDAANLTAGIVAKERFGGTATNTYQLTLVAGVPTWSAPSGGGGSSISNGSYSATVSSGGDLTIATDSITYGSSVFYKGSGGYLHIGGGGHSYSYLSGQYTHTGVALFGATYGTTSDASAQVEMRSTTQGLLPSRMTTTQRDAITAAEGLVIYNTTTHKLECYNGTTWNALF